MTRSRNSAFLAATALLVAPMLVLVGCSSSASAPASPSPSMGSPELAAAKAFAALPPAEQESQLQAVTESVDRQLIAMSGLEKELGSAAKADAAYSALSAKARQLAQSFVDKPDFGKFGAFVPAESAPTQGGMMFANYMAGVLLQDAAVSQAKDVAPGGKTDPKSEDLSDATSGGKGGIKATGDVKESSLEVNGDITVDGVTGKLKTAITVSPCPDPKGQFTSKTTMSASISSGNGTGSNLTIDMEIKGQVDDDAQLVSYDTDTRTQSAKFEGGKGQFVDATVGWTIKGSDWSGYRGKVNRTGGNVSDSYVLDQAKWSSFTAIMMQEKAVEAAKKGWESGRCVTLDPKTQPGKRKGLKPSTTVTITAAPRSKIDGGPVGGTVKAQLSGDTSVDPSGSKVKADAKFTYVAPPEKDKTATVSLEARSKRGVAKADVVFDTKEAAYDLNGHLPTTPGGTEVVATICDATKPFTADFTGDMVGQGTFTPTSDSGGSVVFTGQVGNAPFAWDGEGTYTVTAPADSDAATLDFTWTTTIHIPVVGDQTGSSSESLPLTSRAAC